VFDVISRRHLKSAAIITSRRHRWGERLGDPVLAAATLDHLPRTVIVVFIDGPLLRIRAHQQCSDVLHRALHRRPNHGRRQLPHLWDHRHRRHRRSEPPLLLAALPFRRLAAPATAVHAATSPTPSTTPSTTLPMPLQPPTASPGARTAATS
jgi:hypothetical protein